MEERKEEPASKTSYFFLDRFRKQPAASKPPVDPAKLVPIDQLPMYSEQYPKSYTFVESPPLPMQEGISKVRQSATDQYSTLKGRFAEADQMLKKGAQAACSFNRQVREEWTTVPKAMAIFMGGMAGYILGMRRSAFRSLFYSSTGLATMAAFCYPNEAVALWRAGVEQAKASWFNFQASPVPPKPKVEGTPSLNAVAEEGTYVAPVPELVDVTPVSGVVETPKVD